MAYRELPQLRPTRQPDWDAFPAPVEVDEARRGTARTYGDYRPRNWHGRCHLPGCEGQINAKSELFCDCHRRLDQLIPVLYGNQGIPLQSRWPLTAVYLIGSRKAGAIKIGVAETVTERVAALQTGAPFRLEIFGAIYTLREHAFKIERACHDKLREFGFHLSGEWFDADPEDAYKLMAKMADVLELAWITPGKYISMISADGYLCDVSHYTVDPFRVSNAMLLNGLIGDRS